MCVTRDDIEIFSKPLDPIPMLTEYNEDERHIAQLQIGFATRLRQSAYYITESTKSTGNQASNMSCHDLIGDEA